MRACVRVPLQAWALVFAQRLASEGLAPRAVSSHHASVRPFSAGDDISGLPPYDPDMADVEPGGFDLTWGFVRGIFGRRPYDRAV